MAGARVVDKAACVEGRWQGANVLLAADGWVGGIRAPAQSLSGSLQAGTAIITSVELYLKEQFWPAGFCGLSAPAQSLTWGMKLLRESATSPDPLPLGATV